MNSEVICPNCGLLMRPAASTETKSNGKTVMTYVCPNKWGCGTIVRKEV